MANMIMIGVETEASLYADEDLEWSGWVERAFLGVYTLELLLRFVAGGTKIFWNGWFLLDLFLVCVGAVLRSSDMSHGASRELPCSVV